MDISHLIIFGLATWRIASLFVSEVGPGRIFQNLREKVAGIQHDPDGEVFMIPETFLGGLFSCVWCFSIWVGFGWAGAWAISPEWSLKLAVAFAFSAVAILVESLLQKLRN